MSCLGVEVTRVSLWVISHSELYGSKFDLFPLMAHVMPMILIKEICWPLMVFEGLFGEAKNGEAITYALIPSIWVISQCMISICNFVLPGFGSYGLRQSTRTTLKLTYLLYLGHIPVKRRKRIITLRLWFYDLWKCHGHSTSQMTWVLKDLARNFQCKTYHYIWCLLKLLEIYRSYKLRFPKIRM